MNREYEYLLSLLGAFLQGRIPQGGVNADWAQLVRLAQIHNVTGILGYMVMQNPTICPDEALRAELRKSCLGTIAAFARRGAAFEALTQKLNDAGIPHIVMKGYVLRDCYPVPELRTFGDIDFVIRPEDRAKSHQLMLDLGFQTKNDWEPVYSYLKETEFYEIHTDIMEVDVSDKADYRGYFREMWQHTRLRGGLTAEFTPEYHLLYLLTHIAKHIRGPGAGARMYLDIAAFLKRGGASLDWPWLWRELETLKLKDFAGVVFTACEEWFGVPRPDGCRDVLRETMEEFTAFTMEAGVFGCYQREEGVNALKRTDENRGKLLLRRAFPAAKEIQSRYTYLQKRPWLLPAAWIHRLVKTRASWASHAHEAQTILNADDKEVARLQKISRDIGL